MASQACQSLLGLGESLHQVPDSSLLVYQPVLDRACEALTLIASHLGSQSDTRAKAGDAGAVILQHSQTTGVAQHSAAQPTTPVQQDRCQELQWFSTSQKNLWQPCEAMNSSPDRASKPMQHPAQPLNHPARLQNPPAMNYRPTAEPSTPTPGYTVTTWSPITLLQHMQQKSRAICEAATCSAGAIAAAATIPGGRPTREDSIKEHCSTGIPASKALRQLDVPGPAAEALSSPAAEPDGLVAPVTPDLSGTATAALQTSSARFLKEMEAEDIRERLLMLAEKRRQALLLAQEQHALQHQHLNHTATDTPTQKAQEDRAAATNNLGIRRTSGSGSCNNNMCNSEATMAVSPARHGLKSFHSASASPCLDNSSSTPALSSANITSMMSQQQTTVTPVSQVPPSAPASNPVSQQVVQQSGRGGPALSTAAWHNLSGWLGAEPPRYGSAHTSRLPSFTYGVQALLKPSAREEAVMEALPNAAYAVTAMQGLSAGLQDTTARQLAVAAVAAAKAECDAEVPVTTKSTVPISACGTVDHVSRSADLSGDPRPGSAAHAGGANTPCHSTHTAGAQPYYSADRMEASWQQQQQQAQEAQYQSAWGMDAFAAPAAEGGTHWVAGAFGIQGPDCTYWQQHQQELANAAYGAWGPGMAASQAPAQHSPQQSQPKRQRMPYMASCDPFNLYFNHQQQQQPKSRHAEPRCPSSPWLEGVEYWDYDADDALPSSAEWGYSNSRKRPNEDVFEEMQRFGIEDWQLDGLREHPAKRAHTMI